MKKSFFAVVALAASLTGSIFTGGCNVDAEDYLHAYGNVVTQDGQYSVADLPIESYDWITRFDNGVEITTRFKNLSTDSTGSFEFKSKGVYLGANFDSCYYVCDWYDEYGYCIGTYVEVCDTIYESQSTSDISRAYAAITYFNGGAYWTTYSDNDTYPSGDQHVGYIGGNTWVQDDIFTSNFLFTDANKKAAKPGKPGVHRTVPRVKVLSYSDWKGNMTKLSSDQHKAVERARETLGIKK